MHFYWLQDRIKQGHFRVFWAPSNANKGDYFTKHHTGAHHRWVRPKYLHTKAESFGSSVLQGCVETLVDT
jgi:hypothetical protein